MRETSSSAAVAEVAGRPGEVWLEGVTKTYQRGSSTVHALRSVSVRINPGELVVLLGPSGSGKTTLLNVVGSIEQATSGQIRVSGFDVGALDGRSLTEYRRFQVGFIFQFFNLVPTLTATENVEVVAELSGPQANARARRALESVGLGDRLEHFPAQLSGGEQQRVAIARALVKGAPVLLADEPTGSLDLESGRQILGLLREAADSGKTVLVVTHNAAIAAMADRTLVLRDGVVADDRHTDTPQPVSEVDW